MVLYIIFVIEFHTNYWTKEEVKAQLSYLEGKLINSIYKKFFDNELLNVILTT